MAHVFESFERESGLFNSPIVLIDDDIVTLKEKGGKKTFLIF